MNPSAKSAALRVRVEKNAVPTLRARMHAVMDLPLLLVMALPVRSPKAVALTDVRLFPITI